MKQLRSQAEVWLYRALPAPRRLKFWIGWLLSPRYRLGVHAVIRDEEGRVLILRASYTPSWQLPGGTVGYQEALAGAMRREVREETGLSITSFRPAGVCFDASGRQVHALFNVVVERAEVRLSGEHVAWRYCEPARLPAPVGELVAFAEGAPATSKSGVLRPWG